jgi:hypothetical protein
MMFFNQDYLYKGHSFNSNLNTLPNNAHFLKMDLFTCIHTIFGIVMIYYLDLNLL